MTRHRLLRSRLLLAVVLLGPRVDAMAAPNVGVGFPESSSGQTVSQSTADPKTKTGDGSLPSQPPSTGVALQQAAPASQSAQTPTPVGTAAAPDTHVDGIAASTPSGAAIAPAKQRRVRKFTIRTALVVGAVVAVGIVSAVSLASPARP